MSRRLLEELRSPAAAVRKATALHVLAERDERSLVDAALAALADMPLTEADGPPLRARLAYLLDHKERDQGCDAREQLTRFLIAIGSPEDLDLYLRGVEVHEILRGVDVGQRLRAASLVGISAIDPLLAVYWAVRLLQDLPDTSRFSGEPAVTAIRVLAAADQRAAIYQLLLAHPTGLVGEVAAAALESLGADFPPALYRAIALPYIEADRAVPLTGVIGHIVGGRVEALYDLLITIVTTTNDHHLHRYGVIELAASRDRGLIDRLYRLAASASRRWPEHLVEALRLLPEGDPRRDSAVAGLEPQS